MSYGSALAGTRDAEPAPGPRPGHPDRAAATRANRAFGRRVTWHAAAECGIRQFLDIGAGLPAPGATHETVRRVSPTCRVAYADNDPLVTDRARAVLPPAAPGGACVYLDADLRDPAAVLTGASGVLDFSQPVALLLLAVLDLVADADDPAGLVAELARGLPPGSMLAISHLTGGAGRAAGAGQAGGAGQGCGVGPGCGETSAAGETSGREASMAGLARPRSRDQVAGLFGQLQIEWPGVVPVNRWRPSAREAACEPAGLHGAVARLAGPGEHYRRNAALELAAAHRQSRP